MAVHVVVIIILRHNGITQNQQSLVLFPFIFNTSLDGHITLPFFPILFIMLLFQIAISVISVTTQCVCRFVGRCAPHAFASQLLLC